VKWVMKIVPTKSKSNQINILLIRWQTITTDTDAKVVYIHVHVSTMLLDGRRTKVTSGRLNITTN